MQEYGEEDNQLLVVHSRESEGSLSGESFHFTRLVKWHPLFSLGPDPRFQLKRLPGRTMELLLYPRWIISDMQLRNMGAQWLTSHLRPLLLIRPHTLAVTLRLLQQPQSSRFARYSLFLSYSIIFIFWCNLRALLCFQASLCVIKLHQRTCDYSFARNR